MSASQTSFDSGVRSLFKSDISGGITHYRLLTPRQKLNLPIERSGLFWKTYCDAVADGEDDSLYLAEAIPNTSTAIPIILDIKFSVELVDFDDVYDNSFIRLLVYTYQETMTEHIVINTIDDYTCIVLTNEEKYINDGKIHTHIRLQFPYCKVDLITQNYLKQQYLTKLRFTSVMSCLVVQPIGGLDAIVSIPNEFVVMYGSKECVNSPIIGFHCIYTYIDPSHKDDFLDDYNNESAFIKAIEETFFIQYHNDYVKGLIDHNAFVTDGDTFDYLQWLPYFLSIHYWTRVNIPIIESNSVTRTDIPSDNEPLEERLKPEVILRDLLPLLDAKRFKEEYYFEEIGKAIRSIDTLDNGVDVWASYSQCFDRDECELLWESFQDDGMIDHRTIAWFAKIDSPEQYNSWYESIVTLALRQALTSYQADVAFVIYILNWLTMMCVLPVSATSDNTVRWLEYRNHHWNRSGPQVLKKKALTELLKRCEKLRTRVSGEIQSSNDNLYKSSSESVIESINKLIKNIKTKTYLDNCISFSTMYFFNEHFNKYFHKNKMITGFLNCVFEVHENKLTRKKRLIQREGKPQDYIVIITNRKFEVIPPNSPHIRAYNTFIEKIFPDPAVRNWFEIYMSSGFIGGNIDKVLPFFIGKLANNGKSTIVRLINLAFGPLVIRIPTSLCTGSRGKSNEATAELMRFQFARFAIAQEPGAYEELKGGPTKEYTGNDIIYFRGLYKEGDDCDNQAKIVFITNNYIPVDAPDPALEDRVILVNFGSVFRKDAPSDLRTQKMLNMYPVDRMIDTKLPSIVKGFLWTLVGQFENYSRIGLPTCDSLTKMTEVYWKRTDNYYGFFVHYIEEVKKGTEVDTAATVSIYEAYDKFKMYLSYIKSEKVRPPSLLIFTDRMVRFMGEPTESERWVGFRFKTSNMFEVCVTIQNTEQ